MYCISSKFVDNYSTQEQITLLLSSIDKKIVAMATCSYNNIRFGFVSCNVDLDTYKDLCIWKEILLDKLLGCNCLENVTFLKIQTRIKKLVK